MRLFITGIGGFAGAHLAAHLLAAGHQVEGLLHRPQAPCLAALAARHPGFVPARFPVGDVTDPAALRRALAAAAPAGVFHLAAVAFVPRAGADAARTFAVNALGTLHLLEAVRAEVPACRVVVAGSAAAYGAVPPGALPIDEDTPFRPASTYGLSKAAADLVAWQAYWAHDLAVIRARAFNHTGPGQSPDYVCSDFARQIAAIERSGRPGQLRVGNLAVTRDFSDVRDVVRGYALLMERGEPGAVYNLCAGSGTTVGAIVAQLVAASSATVEVVEEPARIRRREVGAIVGSARRAQALGWQPAIPLADTLRDLLAYWRETPAAGRSSRDT